jgi:hypothetical protein
MKKTGGTNAYLMTDGNTLRVASSSGTTGNKVSFSLAAPDDSVTLDSSGNLLVGTTDTFPGGGDTNTGVSLSSTGAVTASRDGDFAARFNRKTSDGEIIGFNKDGLAVGSIGAGTTFLTIGSGTGNVYFQNGVMAPTASSGGASSNGVVDLGTSSSRFKNLYLSGGVYANNASGAFLWNAENAPIAFGTNNTERMRIDSSGNLLVGVSTFANNTLGVAIRGASTGASDESVRCAVPSTGSTLQIGFYNANGRVGSVSTSGTSTAFNTSSDYRLKENVVEMTGALDRVNQLQPKRFNFIADADTTVDGFLAHEVQDIVPEAITGEKDAVDSEGNPDYQGIDQSKLVPLLTKAIQEQQTIIDNLTTRIEALEG